MRLLFVEDDASIPALRHKTVPARERSDNLSLLLLLCLLHDLLHNLLLLDQESADDAVLDAVGAARAAVCALNGLLRVGDGGVFAWAEGWNLLYHIVSVTIPCASFQ